MIYSGIRNFEAFLFGSLFISATCQARSKKNNKDDFLILI